MKIKTMLIILFMIILISGCTVTEENIEEVAAKMQEVYDGINAIQVDYEQTGFKRDGSGRVSRYVTTEWVDKSGNKRKMVFEGDFRDAGKVANLWVGNDFYDERNDKVYYYSCPTNVFDEPDFIDELRSMLKKWSSIELIGTEIINGKDTYKISLGDEGEGHYLWIDKETYLPLKEFFSGHYEKVYSNYVVNQDIPDDVFAPPTGKEVIEQVCDSEEAGPSEGETEEESS